MPATSRSAFRVIASLIDQVNAKGERLAALDVAKTFLGADVANNLAMLDPISTDLEGGNTRSGRGLATMSAPSRRRSGRRRPSTTFVNWMKTTLNNGTARFMTNV